MKFYDKLLLRWAHRSLPKKLATVILVATALVIPVIFGVVWWSSQKTFLEIEGKSIAAQTARAQNAMHVFEKSLSSSVGDYANWDDSYRYLANPNAAFENSTLNPYTFKSMGVDVITYVRFDKQVVFQRVVDLGNEQILDDESKFMSKFTSQGAFFDAAKANETHIAYVRTKRGVYLLYSEWQSDSLGKAKPSGFVVMGNLIAPQMLSDALQTKAKLNLDINAPLASSLKASSNISASSLSDDVIHSGLGLYGQNKELLAIVEFSTPRSLMIAGRQALLSLGLAVFGGILLLAICVSIGMRMIVVRRLHRLQAYVDNYQTGHQLPEDLAFGTDELAQLSKAFDRLSNDLASAERELGQKSYLQGKADSAAGMLHNVRNALAPIRVTQEKWLREDTLPFRQNMVRAAQELADDAIDPARKASLEAFMVTAARQIALSYGERLAEMEHSKESVNQLAAILGGYNFNTSSDHAGDEIDFLKILKQEIHILNGRDGENVIISLPDDFPALVGNPIHLAQVIGNILVNADEAMIAANVAEKIMTVTCSALGDGRLEIRFQDNGDGISAENLEKIFQRSYSTRTHKAGGIGLHWSANAMRAMGGSISIESEGEGKGSTAVLTVRFAEQIARTTPLAA